MAFHLLSVHEDVLFAHYRLEMHGNVLAFHVGRNGEVLSVPYYALIVAATACVGRFKPCGMRGAHNGPSAVVIRYGLGTLCVAQMEAPALIEVVYHPAAAMQRKQPCNRIGVGSSRCQ